MFYNLEQDINLNYEDHTYSFDMRSKDLWIVFDTLRPAVKLRLRGLGEYPYKSYVAGLPYLGDYFEDPLNPTETEIFLFESTFQCKWDLHLVEDVKEMLDSK